MDSLITSAAGLLARGDALGALNRVALRSDAAALALRGLALAQLGDLGRARSLLKRAIRAFGMGEALARARCTLALAEIALAARDLSGPASALRSARAILAAHGDAMNAAFAHHLEIRHLLLTGRLDQAKRELDGFDSAPLPPSLRGLHQLVIAGIALRRLDIGAARTALDEAEQSARRAGISSLLAEVASVRDSLEAPAARLFIHAGERVLQLDEVAGVLSSPSLVVNACRHTVHAGGATVSLARRPVLFALTRLLAMAWPGDVARAVLIARVFRQKRADESLRARLRVEAGRLRRVLRGLADVQATDRGYALVPGAGREVAVLAPPVEGDTAAVLALLADGQAWSSSALALALGASQRSVQRSLDMLARGNKVQATGLGRARRWLVPPVPGIPTILLLPAPVPGG